MDFAWWSGRMQLRFPYMLLRHLVPDHVDPWISGDGIRRRERSVESYGQGEISISGWCLLLTLAKLLRTGFQIQCGCAPLLFFCRCWVVVHWGPEGG